MLNRSNFFGCWYRLDKKGSPSPVILRGIREVVTAGAVDRQLCAGHLPNYDFAPFHLLIALCGGGGKIIGLQRKLNR